MQGATSVSTKHLRTVSSVTIAILACSYTQNSNASPTTLCRIENFKNTHHTSKPIPHLQWRRCHIAGKALYYVRIFYQCGKRTCHQGWKRSKRRGRHFTSINTTSKTHQTLRFYFPTSDIMKMRIKTQNLSKKQVKKWKVTFRRY